METVEWHDVHMNQCHVTRLKPPSVHQESLYKLSLPPNEECFLPFPLQIDSAASSTDATETPTVGRHQPCYTLPLWYPAALTLSFTTTHTTPSFPPRPPMSTPTLTHPSPPPRPFPPHARRFLPTLALSRPGRPPPTQSRGLLTRPPPRVSPSREDKEKTCKCH